MLTRVCVIGAGLAGGVVAARLAAAGHDVTLIEQGDVPAPLTPPDERWEGADLRSEFTRGQGIGGSSNFWHGGLITLDASDIDGVSPTGKGPRFPIAFSELCAYYRHALQLMTNGTIPLEELLPGSIEEESLDVDSTTFRLKPMFFQERPFSTKGMIEEAVRTHGLRLVTNFTASHLVHDESGRITAVEGTRAGEVQSIRIEADTFALCAGGIGSPKLLLRTARTHIGLRGLPVGKHLIDHPTGFTFKARLRRRRNLKRLFGHSHAAAIGARRRLGFILNQDKLSIAAGRNHVLYLRPAFTLRDPQEFNELKSRLVAHRGRRLRLRDLMQLLLHPDLLAEAMNFRFGLVTSVRHVAGFVFAEQLSPEGNEISLGENDRIDVRWEISPSDRDSLRQFLNAFVERHRDLFEEVVFFPDLLGSGAHHSGGCRMSALPADGVVGGDLRVFGVENLFVSDGSILGFSGHANTGLTIVALAIKCADEIDASTRGRITASRQTHHT